MDNFVDPFADENIEYDSNAEYSLGLNSNSSFTITKLVNIGENSFYKNRESVLNLFTYGILFIGELLQKRCMVNYTIISLILELK